MESHKTVKVEYLDGRLVEIDEDIVDLLRLMWDLGIKTSQSCQNDRTRGGIWIQFDGGESARSFLNLITRYDTPDQAILRDAILDEFTFRINIIDKHHFMADFPEDFNGELDPLFEFNVNMYFDRTYKELVMRQLEDCKKK